MNIRNFLAKIAASGTTSGAVDLGHATLCGIYVPASFTGTTLTFTASDTATGTFAPVKDGAGAAVSKTVAAGDYIYIDPVLFAGIRHLKIVSGSAEAAERVLKLATRIV